MWLQLAAELVCSPSLSPKISILGDARCEILSTMSNAMLDSYVLSESSLFVYTHKVVIKTCGTTTLLRLLGSLAAATEALGLVVEWLGYTRKDFMYPTDQEFPHGNFGSEMGYLKKYHPEGHGYVLGPITGDHWFVFVADYCDRPPSESTDRTLVREGGKVLSRAVQCSACLFCCC